MLQSAKTWLSETLPILDIRIRSKSFLCFQSMIQTTLLFLFNLAVWLHILLFISLSPNTFIKRQQSSFVAHINRSLQFLKPYTLIISYIASPISSINSHLIFYYIFGSVNLFFNLYLLFTFPLQVTQSIQDEIYFKKTTTTFSHCKFLILKIILCKDEMS